MPAARDVYCGLYGLIGILRGYKVAADMLCVLSPLRAACLEERSDERSYALPTEAKSRECEHRELT